MGKEIWSDIKSAPKNGKPIFAMLQHGQCYVMRYWSAEQIAEEEGGSPDEYQEGWYEWENNTSEWAPSWWMPIENLPNAVLVNLEIYHD